MAFASRITRQPRIFDAVTAAEIAARFPGPAADLLAATASCSPFLRDLMQREAGWLSDALDAQPEEAFARLMADLGALQGDQLGPELRRAKGQVALLTGLADLGGVWDLDQVTGALTDFADRSVQLCLEHLIAEEIRRGKLPDAPHGMVVLAMGKMGARELNYSSDIDLICLFDETRHPGTEMEARQAFIRVTRKMTALLSDLTAGGYVFRTDLRLRPDASVMPVCLSMGSALAYYEAEGRTWERAAHIKARPCAGDIAAGERYLKSLTPFVWRRHLDYAAIQDAHDMRLRIRDHKGLNGPLRIEGHNVKLGQGGIREIEFFAQTRQLIAGGRDPDLRSRRTEAALAALASKGWLPEAVSRDLSAAYRQWREVEHRLQMVLDEQTQVMPVTPEGIARMAAFCGQEEATFRRDFFARVEAVETLTEGFFAPAAPAEAAPDLSPQAEAIVAGWANYPALRSDRAQAIFARIRPGLLARLMRAAAPEEALSALDGFLSGLPAGVQLFALFEANPALVDLIVDICATAPRLALYLSRNARVLDAVIGGSFWAPWPGRAGLVEDLGRRLQGADYEQALGLSRIWLKEWHFRVGVHHLRGLIDGFEAGKAYADLAEVVVAALWPVVGAEVARRHGPPPGRGAVVLGMGSLGAARLNAGSDLDLIVIYDAGEAEASEGPKPLAVRPYYAKLTQALVTALTAQTPEGRLYEVDMRLRPSGRQGPVATSLASFRAYQQEEAWTWEHLALTRARVLAGPPDLGAEVEAFRREVLAAKGQGAKVLADVAEMRGRLAEAKPGQGPWEAKNGPGRLMDIELCAQTIALRQGSAARGLEMQLASDRGRHLSQTGKKALEDAARLFWQLQAAGRLLSDRGISPEALGEGARAFLLRETGAGSVEELTGRLGAAAEAARSVVDGVMEDGDGAG